MGLKGRIRNVINFAGNGSHLQNMNGMLFEYRPSVSITTAGAATYTKANLNTGLIRRDPNGAARTDTLPSSADLKAMFPVKKSGSCFTIWIQNTGAATEDLTIQAADGNTTISGSAVIEDGTTGVFQVVMDNATTPTIVVRRLATS